MYQAESGPHINGREMPVPRGKTLGGSSSINGMIYNRGQRMDYDHWAQMGNRGWGYADVLPYFKRCESRVGGEGDDTYRGRDGGMSVETIPFQHPLCDAFIKGAAEVGIPHNPDYNGAKQEGISYVQRTCAARGGGSAPRSAYLHPAKSRSNLTVITNAFATKILLDGKKGRRRRLFQGRQGRRCRRRCGRIPGGDPVRRRHQLAATAATLRHRPGRAAGGAGHRGADTSWPASARTCATTTRRASSSASKTAETLNETAPAGCGVSWEIAKYLAGDRQQHRQPEPLAGLWLLALRPGGQEQRPAIHLHARQL